MEITKATPTQVFDAVIVGTGACGGWAAKELAEAGMEVLVLDAGPMPEPSRDFAHHQWPWENPNRGMGFGRRATPRTRYVLQSAGRPVIAAAVWKLLGDGGIELDARVADVIPEFGTNGKEVVTIRQVLTHTGGFPMAPCSGWAAGITR